MINADLIDRLRDHEIVAYNCADCHGRTMDDAAFEIERLTATVSDLMASIRELRALMRMDIGLGNVQEGETRSIVLANSDRLAP